MLSYHLRQSGHDPKDSPESPRPTGTGDHAALLDLTGPQGPDSAYESPLFASFWSNLYPDSDNRDSGREYPTEPVVRLMTIFFAPCWNLVKYCTTIGAARGCGAMARLRSTRPIDLSVASQLSAPHKFATRPLGDCC